MVLILFQGYILRPYLVAAPATVKYRFQGRTIEPPIREFRKDEFVTISWIHSAGWPHIPGPGTSTTLQHLRRLPIPKDLSPERVSVSAIAAPSLQYTFFGLISRIMA
jgi:hypothetical protein